MMSHWLGQSDPFGFVALMQVKGALPPLGLRPIHPRGIFEPEKPGGL